MLNKDKLKEICDWYSKVPSVEIDQGKMSYCFGGHLVEYLKIYEGCHMAGANAFAKSIGGNLAHVILMFRSIGIRNPFGSFEWEIPHDRAMRLLSEIEDLPETKGADLEGANLYRADLEGANLTRANLEYANLEYANLDGANLEGANLEGAKLDGANVKGTLLEGKE